MINLKAFTSTIILCLSILGATAFSSSALSQEAEVINGKMVANKYGASTKYTNDPNEGFIGFYTKAKVVFYKINDKREFHVDPSFLESDTFSTFSVGDVFSLDIRTDEPRYTATLTELYDDEAMLEIRDSQSVIDIDIAVDLRGEYIDFIDGVIYLRKVGGTLNIKQP